MVKPVYPKFGGLDLAKRIDNSAIEILTLKDKKLYHTGEKIWPHIKYNDIIFGNDEEDGLVQIQEKENMNVIGFDRNNTGDSVMEIFPRTLPMSPIITTMQRKLEIINLVRQLFHTSQLMLHPTKSRVLVTEILEQEERRSEAGNMLYSHPQGVHDDRFWALGYACFTAAPYLAGIPSMTVSSGETYRDKEPTMDW